MGSLIDLKEELANQVSESTGAGSRPGPWSLYFQSLLHLFPDLVSWETKSSWPNLGLGPEDQPGGIRALIGLLPSLSAAGEGELIPRRTWAGHQAFTRESLWGTDVMAESFPQYLKGETEALNESSLRPEGSLLTTEMKPSDSCQPHGNFFLTLPSLLNQWFRHLAMHHDYLRALLKIEELALAWGWCLCIFHKLLI